jgi:hypothetical protein
MISTEQEGIYKGKSSTLLTGIHIKLTYTKDKELSIFLERGPVWDPENLFRLLEYYRLNLTK